MSDETNKGKPVEVPAPSLVKSNEGLRNVTNINTVSSGSALSLIVLMVGWLAGIVLAKGAWSTVASILFFPYAWYLVVERVMQVWGLM